MVVSMAYDLEAAVQHGYFHTGDTVVLGNNENRPLIVTGFDVRYYGRLSGYHKKPGAYLNLARVAVRTPDGVQVPGFQSHTEFSHTNPGMAISRGPRSAKLEQRIGDLPETHYYEGDRVLVGTHTLYVVAIDYSPLMLGKPPRYMLNHTLTPRPISLTERLYTHDELTFRARGNAWRQANDEESMTFETLPEEVLFHLMMGWFTDVEERVRHRGDARNFTVRGIADGYFIVGDDPTTEIVRAFRLLKATDQLREESRRICLGTHPDAPAFRLP